MSKLEPPRFASATGGSRHVFIRNLELLAHIGIYGHEQGKLQPVRINIDHVPKEVTIAAGQTCTIVITPPRPEDNRKEGPALEP